MSEQAFGHHEQPDFHELSPDELRQGYVLQPDETVSAELGHREHGIPLLGYSVGHGVEIEGIPRAIVKVGGVDEFIEGTVIETGARGPVDALQKQYTIVFSGRGDMQPIAMKLDRGQLWGIGRQFDGQGHFPDTVSRDHCAIGLDDSGRLLIENHNPSNYTNVRAIGNMLPLTK